MQPVASTQLLDQARRGACGRDDAVPRGQQGARNFGAQSAAGTCDQTNFVYCFFLFVGAFVISVAND